MSFDSSLPWDIDPNDPYVKLNRELARDAKAIVDKIADAAKTTFAGDKETQEALLLMAQEAASLALAFSLNAFAPPSGTAVQ